MKNKYSVYLPNIHESRIRVTFKTLFNKKKESNLPKLLLNSIKGLAFFFILQKKKSLKNWMKNKNV